jgi:hypothetical protein
MRPFSYAEFVTISKEISTLENEMLELKESLAEWRNMPSLLHIDDSASVAGINLCLLPLNFSPLILAHRAQTKRALLHC